MSYYQIKILTRTPNSPNTEAGGEMNLSEEQVKIIINQYENEESMFIGGRWVKVNDLEHIEIRVTPQRLNSDTISLASSYPNVTRRFIKSPPRKEVKSENKKTLKVEQSKDIFIVHGTDFTPVKELNAIIQEAGLNPIVLHEQASKGMTIIEKLEKYSNVGFAFIILTPDDIGVGKQEGKNMMASVVGKDSLTAEEYIEWSKNSLNVSNMLWKFYGMFKDRARQNVVLEFGYFMGKLGRERICCLYKGDIELPSDMHGICYVPFKDSINEAKPMILQELREAGYEIRA